MPDRPADAQISFLPNEPNPVFGHPILSLGNLRYKNCFCRTNPAIQTKQSQIARFEPKPNRKTQGPAPTALPIGSLASPSVSPTADAVFCVSYGNAAVTASQENRTATDAAKSSTGRSSDWLATTANNVNSPSTFYTIYPENANSLAPSLISLTAGQTEQFSPLFIASAAGNRSTQLTLLGSVQTPSPAESIAINGNTAYVCDDNEVSVIDVTNPSSPRFLNGILAPAIAGTPTQHCSIQRNSLTVFADGSSSADVGGRTPGLVNFSLANPQQPQLNSSVPVTGRYTRSVVFSGNTAYLASAFTTLCCFGTVTLTVPNAHTYTAATNASGIATFSYSGAARGIDTLQASANGFSSPSLIASWLDPATTLTTT